MSPGLVAGGGIVVGAPAPLIAVGAVIPAAPEAALPEAPAGLLTAPAAPTVLGVAPPLVPLLAATGAVEPPAAASVPAVAPVIGPSMGALSPPQLALRRSAIAQDNRSTTRFGISNIASPSMLIGASLRDIV